MICNSEKGKEVLKKAKQYLYGHELDFNIALKYQGPLRKPIETNDKRAEFMEDVINPEIDYKKLCGKWYDKPSIKLLVSKYLWGNRQKIFVWKMKNRNS